MELLIIENNLDKIIQYQDIGIDIIFLDLEIIGKIERQGHLNTVISKHHNIEDVKLIRNVIKNSKLLVRCNPIHKNSYDEINRIIDYGAQEIMLPYFKTIREVETFLEIVNNRVDVNLLFETPQSIFRLENILKLGQINNIHIGLNDLHLGLGLNFMFEILASDIFSTIINTINKSGIPYGIGGIASLNKGDVRGELVLAEYYRLGANRTIISRSLVNSCKNISELEVEIKSIRSHWDNLHQIKYEELNLLHEEFINKVNVVANNKINSI